jgi:uncharacterized protein YndB with AHSA1/START domain
MLGPTAAAISCPALASAESTMTDALEPIRLSIETPADPETAWGAITDPDRIAEWFTDASPLGRVGDPYRLDFGDSAVDGHVLAVDPGRHFAHSWSWDGADPSEQTVVSWTVEPLGRGGSRIVLEHAGWADGDDTPRDDHLGYWESYLEDLAALLAG